MNTLPATITSSLGSVRAFCRAASYAGAVVFRPANHLAPVHCLFGSSRPSTVSRKIPEIVLDAVDGVPNRSLPHVGKKIFKFIPSSADRYSSPAVAGMSNMVFVTTSVMHMKPRNVCRTSGMPMPCVVAFKKKTAARLRVAAAQITGADFSPEMLEVARGKGLAKTVLADAMELQFENESFDVVTVAFGLRNMADWDRALREMFRVLRAHGHLLVLDFFSTWGCLCLLRHLSAGSQIFAGAWIRLPPLAES